MLILNKKTGLTYIETLLSSVIVTLMLVTSVQLLSTIYKGTTQSQNKTISFNLASDQLEALKSNGFSSLPVTPDSCLPDPLAEEETLDNLKCASNTIYPQTVTNTGKVYEIFSIVQYAEEDSDTLALTPYKQSEGLPGNIKMIKVFVKYKDGSTIKYTNMNGFINNSEVQLAGSRIKGNITLSGGGIPSYATVKVKNHPEYSARMKSDGTYTLENLYPGYYHLYCEGTGFYSLDYASNPIIATSTAKDIENIDFVVDPINPAYITGKILCSDVADTPTPASSPTDTPTPYAAPTAIKTVVLDGSDPGSSYGPQDWSNVSNISSNDGNYASCDDDDGYYLDLFADFDNYNEADCTITNVRVFVEHYCARNGNRSGNYFSTEGYNGSTFVGLSNIDMDNSIQIDNINITSLHGTWTWADVNGFAFNMEAHYNTFFGFKYRGYDKAYVDHIWLEVEYIASASTPTPVIVATDTPTPVPSGAATPCYIETAQVEANDGLSNPTYSDSSGSYTISNIDPAAGAGGCLTVTAKFIDTLGVYGSAGDFWYGEKVVCGIYAGATVTADIRALTISANAYGYGYVLDANDLSTPINGATVYFSDYIALSPTTNASGYYSITETALGSYKLNVSCPGYIPSSNSINKSAGISAGPNKLPDLYMYPVGSVSGYVTEHPSTAGISGIIVEIKDASGQLLASAKTNSSGYYEALTIPAGTNYYASPELYNSGYSYYYPSNGRIQPLNLATSGSSVSNVNFQLQAAYETISGTLTGVDGSALTQGVMIIAYPSSESLHADDFKIDNSEPSGYLTPDTRTQDLHIRKTRNFYGNIPQQNGEYVIRVPVGNTYDIYAYYSAPTYTDTLKKTTLGGFTKTLTHYRQILTGVSPGATSQNFTMGGWTTY